MRIEKINENQIRCTLTKEDLANRKLKLSELAYGTEKAKSLFRDMMQQASFEFGFEAEDIPLMIEAIPVSSDCIVLVITKVDDPEELDTRFSKFAPAVIDNSEESNVMDDDSDSDIDFDLDGNPTNVATPPANENPTPSTTAHIEIVGGDALKEFINNLSDENGMMDLFKKITSSAMQAKQASAPQKSGSNVKFTAARIYQFDDLDTVGKACKVLSKFYGGLSSLYKNPEDGLFYMLLEQGNYDKKEFVKVTNLMLEYSSYIKTTDAVVAHMREHYKCLIAQNAVSGMAQF